MDKLPEANGVVALLDCLAWSQINSTRENRDLIVDGLRAIRRTLAKLSESERWVVDGVRLSKQQLPVVQHMSDSMLLAFPEIVFENDPTNELRKTYNLVQTLHLAAMAQISGFHCRIPLLYRGCMAQGEFVIDDQIFIGSAIDWVAKHYEQSIAPIIWLGPRLDPVIEKRRALTYDARTPIDRLVVKYPVPFHGGVRIDCYCINPFAYNNRGLGPSLRLEEAEEAARQVMSSGELAHVEKLQETIRFLEHCYQHIEGLGA